MQKIYYILSMALIIINGVSYAQNNRFLEIRLRDRNKIFTNVIVNKRMHPTSLRTALSKTFSIPENSIILRFGKSITFSPGDDNAPFGSLKRRLTASKYITVISLSPDITIDFSNPDMVHLLQRNINQLIYTQR